MDDDDYVHDEVGDTQSVGVVGPCLCSLEELQHPKAKKTILTFCTDVPQLICPH